MTQHFAAARLLDHILESAWEYLRAHQRFTEYEVQQFISRQFRRHRLRTTDEGPIVAFGVHTAQVHYFPTRLGAARLQPETPILVDIWAALDEPRAPYADITWMAWHGRRIAPWFHRLFIAVCTARDAALRHVRHTVDSGHSPYGHAVDAVARNSIARAGYRGAFHHSLGHSLGIVGPHGRTKGFTPKNRSRVAAGYGYTIEPGAYLPGRAGARCEMDFFLTPSREVIVTTEVQRDIVKI